MLKNYAVRNPNPSKKSATYGLLFPLVCRPDIFQHFLAQLGL
jgi:hypothetical protein